MLFHGWLAGRRPLGTRWVDVNKGDKHSPDVRCRLVAKEVNTYREDAFVAATPSLEALRLLWYSMQRRHISIPSRSVRSIAHFHTNAGSLWPAQRLNGTRDARPPSGSAFLMASLRQWASSVGYPCGCARRRPHVRCQGGGFQVGRQGTRMLDPTEEDWHHWWRQLRLEGNQGLDRLLRWQE